MRDYKKELENRVAFIQKVVAGAKVKGIVFANSGGKDATLTGILCKKACVDTVGVILPCGIKRNYGDDTNHATLVGEQYDIQHRTVDLLPVRDALVQGLGDLSATSLAYIASRLRMTAVYAIANSENRLVAGTGNRSEAYMGYFTKWGDGAYDFNPIGDLTVTEIFEFLRFLGAPEAVINKAPSAGLFEEQTDEKEMGLTYRSLDNFLLTGSTDPADEAVIRRFHSNSEHKRRPPILFGDGQ